jgi:TRAP-type C4-dicarboxylate transport system permease small subunit
LTETRKPPAFLLKLIGFGNKLQKMQIFFGTFVVVSFFAFVTLDVAARTLKAPIIWAQEVAVFSYMWAVLTGSGIALRKGTHFRIDMLVNLMPRIAQNVLNVVSSLLIGVFAWLMIGPGLDFAMMGIQRVSNPSGIPLIYPSIAFPICGVFFLYYLIESLVCNLCGWQTADLLAEAKPAEGGNEA